MSKRLLRSSLAALAFLAFLGHAARAQDALPVASCGTLPLAYKPGSPSRVTVNLNGQLCISGTINATSSTTVNTNAVFSANNFGGGTTQSFLANQFGALFTQDTFNGVPVDGTHGLPVNCIVGCAGGTSSNNADAVATSSTNGQNLSWLYLWNGATWDRWPGDKTNGGFVNVKVLPAITGTVTANAGTNLNTSALALDASVTATQPRNVAQINGVPPLMGNGVTGTGSQRVTIASDNSNAAGVGGSATGSAVPSAARYIGGNASGNLTGITVCDTRARVSETGNTQIISGVSSKKTYICSINLVTATAQNVAIVEGTGSVCAVSTAGVSTAGATAATGWNFAANGGLTEGTGIGVIMAADAAAADNLCIFQSGSGQLSGVITYTQF